MTNSLQNVNSIKAGTCPHGCAPSACPICSGMGGGGRVGERPQKAGEMSYHQCAMIGAMMRAREARIEAHQKNLAAHAEALNKFEQMLNNTLAKLSALLSTTNFIFKPFIVTINYVLVPIINTLKNITNFIKNINDKIFQIKEKIWDIQDKLNAIFGEAKAFLNKKISEIVSGFKTTLKRLFKIFEKNKTKDEENKINEDKRIFNLKTFIQKLMKRKKDDTENKRKS